MPYMKPIAEWNLRFTNMIYNEIPNGFISGIITGERRKGKSAYALKTIAKLLSLLYGYSDDECWEKALECIIFSPDDLTNKVFNNVKQDIISPVICLDDASVHFNPMLFFINPYQVSLLNGIFDTIGTVTNAVILTCPKKARLMKGLKNYDDLTIHIIKSEGGEYERIARGILWYTMPDERQRFRKLFEDHYSCYIPQKIYDKYLIKRKGYLKEVNEKFIKFKNRLDEQTQKKMIKMGITTIAKDMQSEIDLLMNETNNELIEVEEHGERTI